MRKSYPIQDLDCANCAAKMERALRKVKDLTDVHVNFLTLKLTLEAPDERFEAALQEAIQVCKRVEPDCRILC